MRTAVSIVQRNYCSQGGETVASYEGLQFLGKFMSDRPRAISNLPLSEEEAGIVLTMPGRTFADVSNRLDRYITSHTRPVRPPVAVGVHDWL